MHLTPIRLKRILKQKHMYANSFGGGGSTCVNYDVAQNPFAYYFFSGWVGFIILDQEGTKVGVGNDLQTRYFSQLMKVIPRPPEKGSYQFLCFRVRSRRFEVE